MLESFLKQLQKFSMCLYILKLKKPAKQNCMQSLVAESVAQQLEKRIMFRRAMKRAVNALRCDAGAQGIKIKVSGRLNGAEIARSEGYLEGRMPLHTLRANIDYGVAEAKTTYGVIGVKVWIFKGEVFNQRSASHRRRDSGRVMLGN